MKVNAGCKVVENGHTLSYTTLTSNGTHDTTNKGFSYTQTVTGINDIKVDNLRETNNGAIYDLTGRRLDTIPAKGFFISNGKKIVKDYR